MAKFAQYANKVVVYEKSAEAMWKEIMRIQKNDLIN